MSSQHQILKSSISIAPSPLFSSESERKVDLLSSGSGASGLNLKSIISDLTPSSDKRNVSKATSTSSIEEKVFKALADAKIWTSQVAMHLQQDARERFFKQLDRLHDCDEWFSDDAPVQLKSYRDFIAFILRIKTRSKPSLALAPDGTLLAIWKTETGQLTLEFTGNGTVEWVLNKTTDDFKERAAGQARLERLPEVLSPYSPEDWFGRSD